jgi:peptidyl-tRNA hydrolase
MVIKVLIVGLGNIEMMKTKHSIGMQIIDKLAYDLSMKWKQDKKINGAYCL